jgi:hypothetical protein
VSKDAVLYLLLQAYYTRKVCFDGKNEVIRTSAVPAEVRVKSEYIRYSKVKKWPDKLIWYLDLSLSGHILTLL